ncbi:hypothetical protein ACLBXM_09930 [Xanthobacteraceae bacterium A53D]
MLDSVQRYTRDLHIREKIWLGGPVGAYMEAYAAAYREYEKTLKRQADSDQRKAEMFILAASIASSTLMVATFATASLGVLASRAALNVICRNNLNRAFNALHFVSTNRTASFAIGAVYDGAMGMANKKIKESVALLTRDASTIMTDDPLVRTIQLERFINKNMACALQVAAHIQDSPMSITEKDNIVRQLRQAAFFRPPSRSINEEALSKRIELSFYMAMILDSDTLTSWPDQFVGSSHSYGGGNPAGTLSGVTQQSIDVLPSSPNYPRPAPSKQEWWGREAHQTISYRQMGGEIRDRVDTLHREIFSQPFFPERGFWDNRPTTGAAELRKAENTLNQLAERTRPLQIEDVRV